MDTTTPIKLLLVDDNKRLTEAWERLIAKQPDMQSVATLDRADALLSAVRSLNPDVVLIDLTMDGRDPLEALAELSRECPEVLTIVYTGQSRSPWEERARQAGAREFLDKAESPTAVLQAVRRLARGEG